MNIVTIVGARPQFIKAAPVSRAIQKHNRKGHGTQITEIIVHTGQHYDDKMSAIFFRDLDLPDPHVNLDVGSGPHGWQTAQMLMRVEEVLMAQKPDLVMVYGDTNSTLAGALAATKLHIPLAHVEAGLRSFNREMPEEHNRVVSDHLSDLLFCPTQAAIKNLEHEGITKGVHCVGDVMYDSVLFNIHLAEKRSHILKQYNLKPKSYALATVHRAVNTDEPERLKSILHALEEITSNGLPVILPLHPRTQNKISDFNLSHNSLQLIDPVSYLDMLVLEKQAKVILTDSGGVQKEAYWFKIPCVTMRNETEWLETVESGWNVVVGPDREKIVEAVRSFKTANPRPELYGDGRAAEKIVDVLSVHNSLPASMCKKASNEKQKADMKSDK
jgi:UDP-N-acetylglucosamine 2-epimerase